MIESGALTISDMELARELTWLDPGQTMEPEGLTVVRNKQTGARRWVSEHHLVLRDKLGYHWATTYEKGLTESQDCRPFEYASEVVFHRVWPVERHVTVIDYEREPPVRPID